MANNDDTEDGFFTVDQNDEAEGSSSHQNSHGEKDGIIREAIHRDSGPFQEASLCQTIAGIAGNVLEWYDFAVFGYFSDILGKVFFPATVDKDTATIESFVVFGAAFCMRPIGGFLLGYLGDVHGRETALRVSILLMAFPTFAMGCLPSYAQAGDLAIVGLVIVRLLQGLSVGGQLMSSLVYTLESHPKPLWGLYGSFVMAAANFGTLLGGLIAFLLRAQLSEEDLISWGWRIPFLSGVFVSISSCFLGGSSHHVPSGSTDRGPLRALCAPRNLRPLLAATMVPMLWSAGFYISFVWMAIFMTDFVEPPIPGAFGINSMTLLLSVCLFFPVAGWLSDRSGRRRVMVVGGVSLGIWGPLATAWIATGSPVAAVMSQLLLGISLSLWGAPMCAWLVESFDDSARLTSVAVGYNMAHALAGGSAPALATYMADTVALWSPGMLLTILSVVSLTGLLVVAVPKEENGMESAVGRELELVGNQTRTGGADDLRNGQIVDDDDGGLL